MGKDALELRDATWEKMHLSSATPRGVHSTGGGSLRNMSGELAGIREAQVSPILICTSLVLLQPDNAVPECAALPCSSAELLPDELLSFPAALDFPTYDASAEAQEASKKFEPLLKQVRHSLGLVQ